MTRCFGQVALTSGGAMVIVGNADSRMGHSLGLNSKHETAALNSARQGCVRWRYSYRSTFNGFSMTAVRALSAVATSVIPIDRTISRTTYPQSTL
jgi:hypothetical protein